MAASANPGIEVSATPDLPAIAKSVIQMIRTWLGSRQIVEWRIEENNFVYPVMPVTG